MVWRNLPPVGHLLFRLHELGARSGAADLALLQLTPGAACPAASAQRWLAVSNFLVACLSSVTPWMLR